jgi:hypothetical protein
LSPARGLGNPLEQLCGGGGGRIDLNDNVLEFLSLGRHAFFPVEGPLVLLDARADSEGDTGTSTTETQNKMQCRLLLDVVISKGASIFELLASKDKTLLIRRDT